MRNKQVIILGINAYHGDSSACIICDGKIIAAAEEERFRRIKHWAGFPSESIKYCLREANATIEDIEHIAINRKPTANLMQKAIFAFKKHPSLNLIKDRLRNAGKVSDIKSVISDTFVCHPEKIRAEIHNVEHHVAHLSSAFFVSPFDQAAVVSVDGFGDFVGAMWGEGKGNTLGIKDRIFFPHSLGLFYLAFTQFLGFPKYGDEYKVMGLSSYGEPVFLDKMRDIVRLEKNGFFSLNLDYFRHHGDGITMTWEDGRPEIGTVYSSKMTGLFGPARRPEGAIYKEHENIAASMQRAYEEAFFHFLNYAYKKLNTPNLCLAGGCALNSVANGKIFERTPFKEIYIQSAAGDAGGALGAAYYVWNQILGNDRRFVMSSSYWGPQFSETEIENELRKRSGEIEKEKCSANCLTNEEDLCRTTAAKIAGGKIVGWFQGRMEWGPRALGNRSIIVDPRRSEMKDILNARIKRRESFRPFAPSILLEKAGEYFEKDYPDPFMIKVYSIRPEKRSVIPAVTHIDGTGRIQTVKKEDNPLYWKLIKEFEKLTGVPVVLNTSFNENEPIVCSPQEALDCFFRTKMDVLVMGKWVIERNVN